MASAVGRQRGIRKQLSSEDQALNMIAKEAEARLAAKRAARAEARSIRMKELERKQKEIDEQGGVEGVDTVRRKNSSRLNSPSTTSPLGSDSNIASSVDNAVVKEALKETENKYKKAMVNVAQLDNERQTLLYQVEVLKDIIEDLEEGIHNAKDELQDRTKEYNKLTHEHDNVNTQLGKCSHLLSERERILDEHGINFDGTLKESEGDEIDGEREESSVATHHFNGVHDEELEQKFESERLSYQEKIDNLENEISELRSNQETSGSRKQAENARNGSGDASAADFERSFVDVSSEADAIQEDARHAGDLQKQITELKSQVARLEQDNARQEGQVVRLETQVKRYKSQADKAVATEDGLLAEKRKIGRELRQCQEQIKEIEIEKDQLQKRLDKLKIRRGIDAL